MIIDSRKVVSSLIEYIPVALALAFLYLVYSFVSASKSYYEVSEQIAYHQAQALDKVAGATGRN